jgi:hypothetical protein
MVDNYRIWAGHIARQDGYRLFDERILYHVSALVSPVLNLLISEEENQLRDTNARWIDTYFTGADVAKYMERAEQDPWGFHARISSTIIATLLREANREARKKGGVIIWLQDLYRAAEKPLLRPFLSRSLPFSGETYLIRATYPPIFSNEEGEIVMDDNTFAGVYSFLTNVFCDRGEGCFTLTALNPIYPNGQFPIAEWTFGGEDEDQLQRYLYEYHDDPKQHRYWGMVTLVPESSYFYRVVFDSDSYLQGVATVAQWFSILVDDLIKVYSTSTGQRYRIVVKEERVQPLSSFLPGAVY